MMAKTPSLSASMRVSRNSPRRKRSSKRMLDPKIIRPSAVVFVSEIPRKRGGNSENWNERPDFVDDGNDRVHHSDGAVDDRCDEPNPDEDGGPGLPAPIQQAGAEEEHGQYDQAGNDEHQNVQCSAFRSNGVIVAEGAAHWSSCISSRASPLRRAILSPLVVRSSANDRNWVMERPFTDFRVRADHAVRSVSLRRSLDLVSASLCPCMMNVGTPDILCVLNWRHLVHRETSDQLRSLVPMSEARSLCRLRL